SRRLLIHGAFVGPSRWRPINHDIDPLRPECGRRWDSVQIWDCYRPESSGCSDAAGFDPPGCGETSLDLLMCFEDAARWVRYSPIRSLRLSRPSSTWARSGETT